MKCKEKCATAYSEEKSRQLWWAEPNMLPDMQALKIDLKIDRNKALHQEFVINLCLISRWRQDKKSQ